MITNLVSAYLREYCSVLHCAGRVHRHLIRRTQYADEYSGSEVISLEIFDCCDTCPATRHQTSGMYGVSEQSEKDLCKLFESFNQGAMSRADFDNQLAAAIKKLGASWEVAAS